MRSEDQGVMRRARRDNAFDLEARRHRRGEELLARGRGHPLRDVRPLVNLQDERNPGEAKGSEMMHIELVDKRIPDGLEPGCEEFALGCFRIRHKQVKVPMRRAATGPTIEIQRRGGIYPAPTSI